MKYAPPFGDTNPEAHYINANPAQGIAGSPVPAEAIEPPMREIVEVIEAAGLTPAAEDLTQLRQAIDLLITAKSASLATPTKDGLVPLGGQAGQVFGVSSDGQSYEFKNRYELCEFYYFRHPTLRPGFQPAQGGLLENAAELYPEAWAYLQTSAGQLLCKTEAEWQALTTATWATLADGTKVGWDGIGGAPYFAPNLDTGALRLPDLRGMYAEAAGFDSLGVGGVHGDAMPAINGGFRHGYVRTMSDQVSIIGNGAIVRDSTSAGTGGASSGTSVGYFTGFTFDSARVVPVANKVQPRAWGALACVYLGAPR